MNISDNDFDFTDNYVDHSIELRKISDEAEAAIIHPVNEDQSADTSSIDVTIQNLTIDVLKGGQALSQSSPPSISNRNTHSINPDSINEHLEENANASQEVETTAEVQAETHQEAAVAEVRVVTQEVRTSGLHEDVGAQEQVYEKAKMTETEATGKREGIRSGFQNHVVFVLRGENYEIEQFDADDKGHQQAVDEKRVGTHDKGKYEVPEHLINHLKSGKKIIDRRGGKNVEVTLDQVTLMSEEKLAQIKQSVVAYIALTNYIQAQQTAKLESKSIGRAPEQIRVQTRSQTEYAEKARNKRTEAEFPAKKAGEHYHKLMREARFDQNLKQVIKGFQSLHEKIQESKHEELVHRVEQKFLADRQRQEQILMDYLH